MLKNRQEGLIAVHGFCVMLVLCAFYLLWAKLVVAFNLIQFAGSSNIFIYFIGVAAGCLLGLRCYNAVAGRLGDLSWLELFSISQRQLVRIALVLFALAFATKDNLISRLFLTTYLLGAGILLCFLNFSLPGLLAGFFFKEKRTRTLLIGSADDIRRIKGWVARKTNIGLDIVGFLSDEPGLRSVDLLPGLGSVADCERVLTENRIGQIILHQSYLDREKSRQVVEAALRTGTRLHICNDYHAFYDHPVTVDHLGEYTVLTLGDEPLENPINRLVKRALDIAVSLPVVALVLPPLTLLVAIVQRLQSPGPVFFLQVRRGLDRQRFHIFKYRTMHASTANRRRETEQAKNGDARIYAFGRFLRRSSLDELPQFINVLRGEMSIAGPRPHMVEHDVEFSRHLRSYNSRHYVKPGITGLAQSKGYRGEISGQHSLQQRVLYDLQYINRWSVGLDLQILVDTARQVVFPPKTAY